MYILIGAVLHRVTRRTHLSDGIGVGITELSRNKERCLYTVFRKHFKKLIYLIGAPCAVEGEGDAGAGGEAAWPWRSCPIVAEICCAI